MNAGPRPHPSPLPADEIEPLPRSFFEPSAAVVAPRLLGHWLLRRIQGRWTGGPIVETEAYLVDDPACHAFRGETDRNRSMFGPPGHAYVYFIYGCHFCVNAVCRPTRHAEAVLIRAIEPSLGEDGMRARRTVRQRSALTSGPARLCAALAIDRRLDAVDLCRSDSPLIVARGSDLEAFLTANGPIVTTTRIGITRATDHPLRFYLARNPFVSRKQLLRKGLGAR